MEHIKKGKEIKFDDTGPRLSFFNTNPDAGIIKMSSDVRGGDDMTRIVYFI